LAFQNIERQTHALRAPALGTVVETPPAAAPDPGEDDFEGGRMSRVAVERIGGGKLRCTSWTMPW
jgi:hypothetical protein